MSFEFIGGPYDGHVQQEPLNGDRVALKVSLDIFAAIEGRTGWGAPVTSQALYERDELRDAYVFLGPLAPDWRPG